jgi:hypothetical protein
MTKTPFFGRLMKLGTMLAVLLAFSAVGRGEDRFAITIGPHNKLAIFGPKGEKVPEIGAPSVDVPVNVGGISFQVSFGRDINQRLVAILTPSDSSPAELHFDVMGKSVDTSNDAALTLTFSSDLHSVRINPGQVGRVEVNSRRIRQ